MGTVFFPFFAWLIFWYFSADVILFRFLFSVQKIIDSDQSPDLLLSQALSREVMEAGKRFENWQPAQIEDLKKLSKVQKLRLWLKDNIRSSQQLKNFVELAGISAGESDDEVIYFRLIIVWIGKDFWKNVRNTPYSWYPMSLEGRTKKSSNILKPKPLFLQRY